MRKAFALMVVVVGLAILIYQPLRADDPTQTPPGSVKTYEWTGSTTAAGFYQAGTSKIATGWVTNVELSCATCTALYDVEILNTVGLDRAQGVGANAPTGVTDYLLSRTPVTTDGGYQWIYQESIAPKIQNAGNGVPFTVRVTVVY